MKKGLKDVLAWMLCLVMIAGAVACTGEKGAPGQKVAVPEVQRGKQAVTHGMHREKRCTRVNFATEEVVVENNWLSSKQIDDFAAKAKGCDARGDCKQIVKEMEDLSLAQRNDLIVTCASDAAACKEKYGDIPANSLLVHEAIDRALGEDIPWSMKNDLSVLLMQQMDESGIVTSTDFAQQLQTIYGLDSQKAEILAGAAMAAVTGGLGKAGKLPAVNPSVKIATGQAVGAFEKSLAGLPPGERVAIIKQTAPKVAAEHGMVKDNQLTKKNGGRDVYRGQDGNLYALDTQHGRFEVVSPKGKHLGEVDFSMQVRKPADTSGGHNLKVK
ncbi:colicin E3/pyocin S6 family cytotoxin [Erwinia amylovora]|nr:colicin E3/pyocin S6 family cytotoxin [Erwinia amylovora]